MNSTELSHTFTDRSNCRRAAKRECGEAFEIERVGDGFAFRRLPATRFPTAAKLSEPVSPGLARLRAAPQAEAIRAATVQDQVEEFARQAAMMNATAPQAEQPKEAEPAPTATFQDAPDEFVRQARAITKAEEPKEAAPRRAAKSKIGKRAAILAAAQAGALPTPPDFIAATHARFRGKLAELTKLAEAGDIEGLKAFAINPISSSPKALDRYRNLCVLALEARMTAAAA